jgi:hypothetical protein
VVTERVARSVIGEGRDREANHKRDNDYEYSTHLLANANWIIEVYTGIV